MLMHLILIHKSRILSALGMMAAASLTLSSCAAQAMDFGVYGYSRRDWPAEVSNHFPIVVYQYRSWDAGPAQVRDLVRLSSDGQTVIVDFEFLQSIDQRLGKISEPPVSDVVNRLVALMRGVGSAHLGAITLDEENIPSPRRIAYLDELYRAAKEKFPDQKFVQWLWAGVNISGVDSLDFRKIGSDGWVVDPYLLTGADYLSYVNMLRQHGGGIYSVVWTAPSWEIGARSRTEAGPDWWNASQWKVFYNRLAVNQNLNIATIFYVTGLHKGQLKSLWSGDPCDQAFYNSLIQLTLPYLRNHVLPATTPSTRPSWLPAYCGQ